MSASKIRAAVVAAGASLTLSACMMPYGGVGVGYGNDGYYGGYGTYGGYGGYGYDPYSYGYGSYGSAQYPYGYGYGSGGYPYGGWYDSYYYPGSGVYVYSRDGSRHRWSESQQRYWEARRNEHREGRDHDGDPRWSGHSSPTPTTTTSTGSTTTVRAPAHSWSGTRGSTGTRSWGTRPARTTESTSATSDSSPRAGGRRHPSHAAGSTQQREGE